MCTCTCPSKIELEFGVWVFVERGKPENPEKNPWSKDKNQQQTQPTYGTRLESNPGHTVGRQALSPLRHPFLPFVIGQSDFWFWFPNTQSKMTLHVWNSCHLSTTLNLNWYGLNNTANLDHVSSWTQSLNLCPCYWSQRLMVKWLKK